MVEDDEKADRIEQIAQSLNRLLILLAPLAGIPLEVHKIRRRLEVLEEQIEVFFGTLPLIPPKAIEQTKGKVIALQRTCARCSNQYTARHPRQKYCENCRSALHAQGKL